MADYGVVRTMPVYLDHLDGFGIMYHGRYIYTLDHAVTDYWHEVGWSVYNGFGFVIRSLEMEYLVPLAKIGTVDVHFRVSKVGTTSVTYEFEFMRGDVLHARGRRTLVQLDTNTLKPAPLSAETLELLSPLVSDEQRAAFAPA